LIEILDNLVHLNTINVSVTHRSKFTLVKNKSSTVAEMADLGVATVEKKQYGKADLNLKL